ncbi:hypothetical protein PTMSG1_05320 [Pyrenophora teres f. maculata]|nr:hypothetical protein PTMSG1_05320 [Pyrenophora teres f. maculata]
MADCAKQHAPGAYTHDQVVKIAEEYFPDAFNAILDVDDVPWERPDNYRVDFSEHSIFLGYITISNVTNKVSAYLSTTGDIRLFRREVGLSRRENEKIELASFWAHLAERAEWPGLENLKALCAYYFVAAGYTDHVQAKKGWFQDLEMACKNVGVGRGVLAAEPIVANVAVQGEDYDATESQDGDVEDGGGSGEKTEATVVETRRFGAGVEEVKVARILQRLLVVVKTRQKKWGEKVEEELRWAWRDYRKYWR